MSQNRTATVSAIKIKVCLALLVVLCPFALADEKPKPFRTINIASVKSLPSDCEKTWEGNGVPSIWVDDQHLLGGIKIACSLDSKSQVALALVNVDGSTRTTLTDSFLRLLPGPDNTILVDHGTRVDVIDLQLKTLRTLECPEKVESGCWLIAASSPAAGSDFAICSLETPRETCDLYQGSSANKVERRKLISPAPTGVDPYAKARPSELDSYLPVHIRGWNVSPDEVWYFDKHADLTRIDSTHQVSPVIQEQWKPKDNYCEGQPSIAEPRRFLAVCTGTHWYSDGMFDALFGYSRVALFDVQTRHILARIDGSAYISASLSPSGKLIATDDDGHKIRFYRVDSDY